MQGVVPFPSEAVEQDGYLYLGSWRRDSFVQVDATKYLPLRRNSKGQ